MLRSHTRQQQAATPPSGQPRPRGRDDAW
jgi:hypothetical protein